MNGQSVLILGATSSIAQSVGRIFAERKCRLALVARNREHLESVARDLRVRGAAEVLCFEDDLSNTETHSQLLKKITDMFEFDSALIAYGSMPNQTAMLSQFSLFAEMAQTNFVSQVSLGNWIAEYFAKKGKGYLGMISSPAGDRGRKSNFLYGSTKGALTTYLQGLRNAYLSKGVKIATLIPGMVDTPMTASLKKGPLFASSERVGKGIVKAMDAEKDVAYVPGFWRWIMLVIQHIPESIFKRMSL